MPKQIFGAESVVTTLNRAFNDVSPSNATFNNQVAAAGTTSDSFTAFAKQYGAGYAGQTADALSTLILGNLGVLPNAALQTALKDYITAAGISNIGIIALQLGDILSGLENATGDQAGFKAAAVAWNTEVTAAYNYSSNPANTTPSDAGPITTPGATFTLAAGADNISPTSADGTKKSTSGDDTFRADAAANVLETIDSIDGGAGVDTINVALNASGLLATPTKPVLKNVEKVNITNVTAASFLSLADSTGVTDVVSKASTAALTVSGVALTTKVGLSGTVTGASTFEFASATGSSDSATLTLSGVTAAAATTIANIETLNVAVSGGASSVTALTAANAKTVNVTGTSTAGLTLNGTYGAVTKFDASGYKGDLTVDLSSAVLGVTVNGSNGGVNAITLGAGNDVLKFSATSGSTISKLTTVTGFGFEADKLDLSSYALGADTTASTTAVAVAGDIAGFFSGTGRVVINDATNTVYVDVNKDGNFNAGTDLAVVLNGMDNTVVASTFSIADITLA